MRRRKIIIHVRRSAWGEVLFYGGVIALALAALAWLALGGRP